MTLMHRALDGVQKADVLVDIAVIMKEHGVSLNMSEEDKKWPNYAARKVESRRNLGELVDKVAELSESELDAARIGYVSVTAGSSED